MEKSDKVTVLSNIVLVGFVVAVIFHYILGFYLKLGIPFDSFLCNGIKSQGTLFFSDFNNLLSLVKDFAPYQGEATIWGNYFPIAYILLYPFALIQNKTLSYFIYISIFLSFFTLMNIKIFKCKNLSKLVNFNNIFILTVLSYPILSLLVSGNFDMFLFIIIALFIYTFKAEKYLSAAALLGLANAIKPFFLIFICLFLFKKRWKEFLLALTLTILFIIGGFITLKGGFFNQINDLNNNLALYIKIFVYNPNNLIIGSSDLFLALRYLLCTVNEIIPSSLLVKTFAWLSSVTGFITLIFAFREKIFWKQIALLILYVLTMSYVILDYKLIFLFIPIWLFINTKEKTNFDLAYTILFGLLLIPKKILMIGVSKVILFSKIFNPLIMLFFMGLIIFEQFYTKKHY